MDNTRHNNTVTIYGLITVQITDIAYETTNDTTLLCTALLALVLPVA